MRRDYRLRASPDDALAALRDRCSRALVARIERRDDDELDLRVEGDRFTIFLGPDGPSQPVAAIRGQLKPDGPFTIVTTHTALASLRPGAGQASVRELAEWALVIVGLAVVGVAFGLRTGGEAVATVLRWSLFFVGIVGVRVARRVLRRRRDQAELVSLVQGALGPLEALPGAGPFRA